MANILEVLLLGLVQGLTEWLPISSSGHLVIVQEYLGIGVPVAFDVMLHLATLVVVVVFFRSRVASIFKSLAKLDFQSDDGRMILFIVLGNVPTAILAIAFHDVFISLFNNLLAVGTALILTGIILYISEARPGSRPLGYLDSLIMGIAQGVAIAPGLSRSGLTIGAGLLRKARRYAVAELSFLLSIPAVTGATFLEAGSLASCNMDPFVLVFGFLVAATVAYASLKLFLRIIMEGKLHLFSYYCWALGLLIIMLQL